MAAVASQFVNAGSSLLLQVIAARTLGAEGFARFVLLSAGLITITTLQTAWVGDSLTVLDRFDPGIRAALVLSVIGTTVLGLLAGIALAVSMGLTGFLGTVLYAMLICLWLLEEVGRRLMGARLEFGRLVLNDLTYVTATLVTVYLFASLHSINLDMMLASMSFGALVAIIAACLQLPREEYGRMGTGGADLRTVAKFAGWRSGQAGLRPLSLLSARIAISTFASRSALASIEAARLLISPVLTLINGVGSFLLPNFAVRARRGFPLQTKEAVKAGAAMAAGACVTGAVALAFADELGPLITSGRFELDRTAVLGWSLLAVSIAVTMPLVLTATAYRMTRLVFIVRAIESVAGLGLTVLLLSVRSDLAALTPYCLGIGGVVSAAYLWRRLGRGDRDGALDDARLAAEPVQSEAR
jgi:O-antigen/teichoic acid export membrane protein